MFVQPNIKRGTVTELGGRQPSQVFIAFPGPFDLILPPAPTTARGDDLIDCPLFDAIIDDRRGTCKAARGISEVVVRVKWNELGCVESGTGIGGVW